MRVVAISRILDEADIIEAFLRHTAFYVDHHVILDNGSRDGTLEIMASLKEEGLNLTVFRNVSVSMNERQFNTLMYHHAAIELQADWVLCLDADEFIDDRSLDLGLAATLERVMRDTPDRLCVKVPYVDYFPDPDQAQDEPIVPLRFRHRRRHPKQMRKVFVRAHLPGALITSGNHDVWVHGVLLPGQDLHGLRLAHYPRRSLYQVAAKSAKGWAKVMAAGPAEVARGSNRHYRPLFERLRDAPQDHFLHPDVMPSTDDPKIVVDPITYRGGALRYTSTNDEPMRAIREMMGYLDDLATRYGLLLEACPDARALNDAWNRDTTRIL